MNCNYNNLVRFMENKLDLDRKLDTLLHVERCINCFDEIYKLKKIKDKKHFVYKGLDEDIEAAF